MFYLIPAASSKLIDPLITLVLKAEKALMMEVKGFLVGFNCPSSDLRLTSLLYNCSLGIETKDRNLTNPVKDFKSGVLAT